MFPLFSREAFKTVTENQKKKKYTRLLNTTSQATTIDCMAVAPGSMITPVVGHVNKSGKALKAKSACISGNPKAKIW